MPSKVYSQEDIMKAKNLAELLRSFNNKSLRCVSDSRVTDNNRDMVIAELLVREFGDAILNKGVIKLFGEDTLTSKYAKR